MRGLILGFILAFLGAGSGPCFATSGPCDVNLLRFHFAWATAFMLERHVVTPAQVEEAANSPQPLSPLWAETRNTRNGSAVDFYTAAVISPDTISNWATIREELHAIAASALTQEGVRAEIRASTEPILEVHEVNLPTLQSLHFPKWYKTRSGRLLFSVKNMIETRLEIHDFDSQEIVWRGPTGNVGNDLIGIEENAKGEVQAVFFHAIERDRTLWEKWRLGGKSRFVRRVVNTVTGEEQEKEFFLLVDSGEYSLLRSQVGPDVVKNQSEGLHVLAAKPYSLGTSNGYTDFYFKGNDGAEFLVRNLPNDNAVVVSKFAGQDLVDTHKTPFPVGQYPAHLKAAQLRDGRFVIVHATNTMRHASRPYVHIGRDGAEADGAINIPLNTVGLILGVEPFVTQDHRVLFAVILEEEVGQHKGVRIEIFEPEKSFSPIWVEQIKRGNVAGVRFFETRGRLLMMHTPNRHQYTIFEPLIGHNQVAEFDTGLELSSFVIHERTDGQVFVVGNDLNQTLRAFSLFNVSRGPQSVGPGCEARLGGSEIPFVYVSSILLKKGVVTPEQLLAAANSQVPVSPLHGETRATRNGSAIDFYAQNIRERSTLENWNQIRQGLRGLVSLADQAREISVAAEKATDAVLLPREIPLPVSIYNWFNTSKGQVLYTAAADAEPPHLFDLITGETLFKFEMPGEKKLDFKSFVGFEEDPAGDVHLIFWKSEGRPLSPAESVKQVHKTRFVRRLMNLRTRYVEEKEFFLKDVAGRSDQFFRQKVGPDVILGRGGNYTVLGEPVTEVPASQYVHVPYYNSGGIPFLVEHRRRALGLVAIQGNELTPLLERPLQLSHSTENSVAARLPGGVFAVAAASFNSGFSYFPPTGDGGVAPKFIPTNGDALLNELIVTRDQRVLLVAQITNGSNETQFAIFEPGVSNEPLVTTAFTRSAKVYAYVQHGDKLLFFFSDNGKVEIYDALAAKGSVADFIVNDHFHQIRAFNAEAGQIVLVGSGGSGDRAFTLFNSARAPQSVKSECEGRLSGAPLPFVHVSSILLKKGVVNAEQLLAAANSPVPVNPLSGETRDTRNGSALDFYEHMLQESSTQENWTSIRAGLNDLVSLAGRQQEIREEAVRVTEAVLNPDEVSLPNVPFHVNWFNDRDGRLLYVSSNAARGDVEIWDFEARKVLWSAPRSLPDYGMIVALEQNSDGDLELVYWGYEERRLNIFERWLYPKGHRYVRRVLNTKTLNVIEDEFFMEDFRANKEFIRLKTGTDLFRLEGDECLVLTGKGKTIEPQCERFVGRNGEHHFLNPRLDGTRLQEWMITSIRGKKLVPQHTYPFVLEGAYKSIAGAQLYDGKFVVAGTTPAGINYFSPSFEGSKDSKVIVADDKAIVLDVFVTTQDRVFITVMHNQRVEIFEPEKSLSPVSVSTLEFRVRPRVVHIEANGQPYFAMANRLGHFEILQPYYSREPIAGFQVKDLANYQFVKTSDGRILITGDAAGRVRAISLFNVVRGPQSVDPECERRLAPQSFTTLTEKLLRSGVVEVEDLEPVVDSPVPVSPLQFATANPKKTHAISLYRALVNQPDTHANWATIREEISALIGGRKAEVEMSGEAREGTAAVVFPKVEETKLDGEAVRGYLHAADGRILVPYFTNEHWEVRDLETGNIVHQLAVDLPDEIPNLGAVSFGISAAGDVEATFFKLILRQPGWLDMFRSRSKEYRVAKTVLNMRTGNKAETEFLIQGEAKQSNFLPAQSGPDIVNLAWSSDFAVLSDKPHILKNDIKKLVVMSGNDGSNLLLDFTRVFNSAMVLKFNGHEYAPVHSVPFRIPKKDNSAMKQLRDGRFVFAYESDFIPQDGDKSYVIRYLRPSYEGGGEKVTIEIPSHAQNILFYETHDKRLLLLVTDRDSNIMIFEPEVSLEPIFKAQVQGSIPRANAGFTEANGRLFLHCQRDNNRLLLFEPLVSNAPLIELSEPVTTFPIFKVHPGRGGQIYVTEILHHNKRKSLKVVSLINRPEDAK